MAKKKTPNELRIRNSTAEFLTFIYQTGGDGVEVRVQGGTIWLSQKTMGELFETSSDNIGLHLKNINKEGELNLDSVTEEFSVTAKIAKEYAESEFEKYRTIQDRLFQSDFDRFVDLELQADIKDQE